MRWRGSKFGGNDVFNQTIHIELRRTHILLCVISPRYLAETSLTMPGLVSGMAGRDSNSTKSFT